MIFLLFSVLIGFGNGMEMRSSMEGSCPQMQPKVASNVDMAWLRSVRHWNFLGGNKFMWYMGLQLVSGDDQNLVTNVSEDDLVSKTCFQMSTQPGTWTLSGLDGSPVVGHLNVTESGPGMLDAVPFIPYGPSKSAPMPARHFVSLTDNRSFFLFNVCFPGMNQKAWGIFSTDKNLSSNVMTEVEKHLESTGFSKKHFVWRNFNKCAQPQRSSWRQNKSGNREWSRN